MKTKLLKTLFGLALLSSVITPIIYARSIEGQTDTLNRSSQQLGISTYSVARNAVTYVLGIQGAPYPTFNTFVNVPTKLDGDERTFTTVKKCTETNNYEDVVSCSGNFANETTIQASDITDKRRYRAAMYFHNNGQENDPKTTATSVEIGLNLGEARFETEIINNQAINYLKPFGFIYGGNTRYFIFDQSGDLTSFCNDNDGSCNPLSIHTITDDLRLQLLDGLSPSDFNIRIVPGSARLVSNQTTNGTDNVPSSVHYLRNNTVQYDIASSNGETVTITATPQINSDGNKAWIEFDKIPGCFRYNGTVFFDFIIEPIPKVCTNLELQALPNLNTGEYIIGLDADEDEDLGDISFLLETTGGNNDSVIYNGQTILENRIINPNDNTLHRATGISYTPADRTRENTFRAITLDSEGLPFAGPDNENLCIEELVIPPVQQECKALKLSDPVQLPDGSYTTSMTLIPGNPDDLDAVVLFYSNNGTLQIGNTTVANQTVTDIDPTQFDPSNNNSISEIRINPVDPNSATSVHAVAVDPETKTIALNATDCVDNLIIQPSPPEELVCEDLQITYDDDTFLDNVPSQVTIGEANFNKLISTENQNALSMRYNIRPEALGESNSPIVVVWEARTPDNRLLGLFAESVQNLNPNSNSNHGNPFDQVPPNNIVFWGVNENGNLMDLNEIPDQTVISAHAEIAPENVVQILNAQNFALLPDFIKNRNYYRSLRPFVVNSNLINKFLGVETAKAQQEFVPLNGLERGNQQFIDPTKDPLFLITNAIKNGAIKNDVIALELTTQNQRLAQSLSKCTDQFTITKTPPEETMCVEANLVPHSIPLDGGDQIFVLDVAGSDGENYTGDFVWEITRGTGDLEAIECPDSLEVLLNDGVANPANTLNEAFNQAFVNNAPPNLEIPQVAANPDTVTTTFGNHCVRLSNASDDVELSVEATNPADAANCQDSVERHPAPMCIDLNLEPTTVIEGNETLLTLTLNADSEFLRENHVFEFRAKSGEILGRQGGQAPTEVIPRSNSGTGEQIFRTRDNVVRYIGAEPGLDQVVVAVLDLNGDPISVCEDSLDVRAENVVCADLNIVKPTSNNIDTDNPFDIEIEATDSEGNPYEGTFTFEALLGNQHEGLFEDTRNRRNPLDTQEKDVKYSGGRNGTVITVQADTGGNACKDQLTINIPDNPEGELEKKVARYRNSSRNNLDTSFRDQVIVRDGDFVQYRIEYNRHPNAVGVIDVEIKDSVSSDNHIKYRDNMEVRHGNSEIDKCDSDDVESGVVCYIGEIGDRNGITIYNTTKDITIYYDAEIVSPIDDQLCNDIDLDHAADCAERYPNTVEGQEMYPGDDNGDEDHRDYQEENELNEDDAEVVAYCDYDDDIPSRVRFEEEICKEEEQPPGEIQKKVAKYKSGSRSNLISQYQERVAVVNGDYVNFRIEYDRNSNTNGRIDVTITDNISDKGYLESRGGGRINYADNMKVEYKNREIDECDDDDVERGAVCYIGEIGDEDGVTVYNTTDDITIFFDGQVNTEISDAFCDELDRDLAHNCGESFTNIADAVERFPDDLNTNEDDREYRKRSSNNLNEDEADVIALCPYFFSDSGNVLLEDGKLPGTIDLSLCIEQPQTKIVIVPKIVEITKTIIKTGKELITDASHEVCKEGYSDSEGEQVYGENVSGLGGVCEFSLDVAAQWESETIEKTIDQAIAQVSQYNKNLNDTNNLINPDLTDDGYTTKNELSTSPNPNPRNHIYVKDNGDLVLGSKDINELVVGGESKTIIVKGHDLFIESNILYGDLDTSLGIIVIGGNIVVSPNVTELNGVFFAQALDGKGGHLTATDEPDQFLQLRINGQVYADIESILKARNYVGDPLQGGGNVVISYRLHPTPPGLSEVTGISFGEVAR